MWVKSYNRSKKKDGSAESFFEDGSNKDCKGRRWGWSGMSKKHPLNKKKSINIAYTTIIKLKRGFTQKEDLKDLFK